MESFKDTERQQCNVAGDSTYVAKIGSSDLFVPAHFILVLT